MSQIDVYTLCNVILSNEMRQKYNFPRRYWKTITRRSSFFMCLNKHIGEIIIR